MSEIHDPYDDQLRAARYRAERDQAMEELARAEGGARAARRTYDALSDEDRRILWWVHARGGLRDVKRQRKKSVPREVYERKRAAWRCHIRECEEALRKRNRRIKELEGAALERRTVRAEDREAAEWARSHGGIDAVETRWDNDTQLADAVIYALWPYGMPDGGGNEDVMDELSKRLMPDGMEWPRFESGELVRSGDKLFDDNGDWFRAVSFIFTCDWWCIEGYQQIGFGTLSRETKRKLSGMPYGERVKRPAPKVLDADGVEIRVGDTVYHIKDGSEMTVYGIDGEWLVVSVGGRVRHDVVTHRATVLAADGKPLREGETVYLVGSGLELEVDTIFDHDCVACVKPGTGQEGGSPSADELTHERPDSWKRLEADARSIARDIAWNLGNWSPSDFKEADDNVLARIESLIPRAKALADRSEK